jgi:hypothetical protein
MILDEHLNKLHSKGYWRVIIRPISYQSEFISNLPECWKIINENQIRLRGWSFPYISESRTNGDKWISSFVDFASHGILEYWRYYQSGQFVHHFSMTEDWEIMPKTGLKGLEVVWTIYRLTEAMFFVSRLATAGVLRDRFKIIIELIDTQDRELFIYESGRSLWQKYVCNMSTVSIEKELDTNDAISNYNSIALEFANHIFNRFNWNEVPMEVLIQDQKNLLSGRY